MPSSEADRVQLHWSFLLALAVFGMVGLFGARGFFSLGDANDDAAYALVAYRLASGESFFLPGSSAQYLPGHPLLLAPFAWVLPPQGLRWVTSGLTCLTACLVAWLTASKLQDRWSGFLVGTLFLLNPVTLTHGSTLLAEPTFAFLVMVLLLAVEHFLERDINSRWGYGLGLGIGWMALVRTEGLALGLFLIGRLWWSKATVPWRAMVAFATPFASYWALLRVNRETGAHYQQLQGFYQDKSLVEAIFLSLKSTGGAVAHFLELPAAAGFLLLGLGLLGALAGGRKEGVLSTPTTVVVLVAPLTLWPYPDPRYWMAAFPLLLYTSGLLLSTTSRRVFYFVLLLAMVAPVWKVFGVSAEHLSLDQERWECYRWLREESGPTELVMTLSHLRLTLRTDRPAVPTPQAESFCDFLAQVCQRGVRYYHHDPSFRLKRDLWDRPQAQPFQPEPWLKACSFSPTVVATRWDSLYRFEMDPDQYLTAYHHYRQAFGKSPEQAEQELKKCLRLVDDFPEARVLLAWLWLQKAGSAADGVFLLETVHQQYPPYWAATRLLAEALEAQGRTDEASKVRAQGEQRARQLGLDWEEQGRNALPGSQDS